MKRLGQDVSGVWHTATVVSAASMNTACGKRMERAIAFAPVGLKLPGMRRCELCAVVTSGSAEAER